MNPWIQKINQGAERLVTDVHERRAGPGCYGFQGTDSALQRPTAPMVAEVCEIWKVQAVCVISILPSIIMSYPAQSCINAVPSDTVAKLPAN